MRPIFAGAGMTSIVFAMAATPAHAQQANAAPSSKTADAGAQPLSVEEIIVTAQKREADLQDVPISMSAFSGDDLNFREVRSLADLQYQVPNLNYGEREGGATVTIRGVGLNVEFGAVESGVATHIDGHYQPKVTTGILGINDLERVEVLRGPQGTLFGRNTTAGLFNIIPKKPTDEYEGFIQGEYGELDREHVSLGVGGPIVKNRLDFRVSALWEQRDGYMENTTAPFSLQANPQASGRERKGYRVQLGAPNLAGANVVVSYEHVDVDRDAGGWEFRQIVSDNENIKTFFRAYDPDADFTPFNYKGSVDQSTHILQHFDNVVVNGSYDISKWTVNLVGGYAWLDEKAKDADPDFTPAPIFFSSDKDKNPQATAELRTESPSLPGFLGLSSVLGRSLGTSDLTAGVFFQRREINDSVRPIGLNAAVAAQFLACQGLPLNAVAGLPVLTVLPPGFIVPACNVNIPPQARVFEETTSSNDIVEKLASDGLKEGVVVFAEAQTKARGRLGRKWLAPARKGLWFSILLRPRLTPQETTRVTVISATALRRAIEAQTGLPARIKWPNDIVVHGRKVSGILTELHGELDRVQYVVLGIGVDVNLNAGDFPPSLRSLATSLKMELGRPVSRSELAAAILEALDREGRCRCGPRPWFR